MEAKKGSPKVQVDGGGTKLREVQTRDTVSQRAQITRSDEEHLLSEERREDRQHNTDIELGQLRQRHAVDNPLVGNMKESILKHIFPPGKKATGIRRYMISMLFLFALDALIWGIFAGVYSTSVLPVLELADGSDMYEAKSCLVVSQRMDHDVSLAYFSLWRSEITVQYNQSNAATARHAQIHDSVTGIYGRLSVAITFLNDFPVGRRFTCHVMTHNLYFAAVQGEQVLQPVILGLVILGVAGTVIFWALFRAFASFLRFKRDYVWDDGRQVWIVKQDKS